MNGKPGKGGWRPELVGGSPAVEAFREQCIAARRKRLAPHKTEIDAYFKRQVYAVPTEL